MAPTGIKLLRQIHDLTQFEVAKRAGISESRYWRIEAGRRPPRPAELEAIAAVFGCSASDLAESEAGDA